MRKLNFIEVQHVCGATKEYLELHLKVNVPGSAGELFGSLMPKVLDKTLSLEEFANAILASSKLVNGSQVKAMEMSAWHSNW